MSFNFYLWQENAAVEDVIADTKVTFLLYVLLLILVEIFLLVVFNFDASEFSNILFCTRASLGLTFLHVHISIHSQSSTLEVSMT